MASRQRLFFLLFPTRMKNTLYLLVLLLHSITSHGQVIRSAGDTTTLGYDLRLALSTLDPTRTSTQILMDQVVALSGPHQYDGKSATAVNAYPN